MVLQKCNLPFLLSRTAKDIFLENYWFCWKSGSDAYSRGWGVMLVHRYDPLRTKIDMWFTLKDKIPESLRIHVACEFACARCNANRGNSTSYHDKYLHIGRKSNVFQHFVWNYFFNSKGDEKCFDIIDTISSSSRLKVKEALCIKWRKPTLNGKKQHLNLLLSF